eukprot:m.168568 g.168568  ORF g.168568 m.168568 type:complete len:843 (+) comp15320_c0_seq10:13-2541(+)
MAQAFTKHLLVGFMTLVATSTALTCRKIQQELGEENGVCVRSATSRPLKIVWFGKAYVEDTVSAEVCAEEGNILTDEVAHVDEKGALVIDNEDVSVVYLSAPWNRLQAHKLSAEKCMSDLPALSESSIAACSDGVDNDGDGLYDQMDPGCGYSFRGLSEDKSNDFKMSKSNFEYTLAADKTGGVYFSSLKWNDKPVISDTTSGSGRLYLHSDSGTGNEKFTSDIELFEGELKNAPGQPIFPWQPNTTTWKNQTAPTKQEGNADINYTIVSQNESIAIVSAESPSVLIVDTFRFSGDEITTTVSVTNKLNNTGPNVIYFGLHVGNLELGTTQGCKCTPTLISGHGSADGHGQASNCTSSCNSGLYHLDRLRRGAIQQGQPFDNMQPNSCCVPPAQLKGWRSLAARGNAYPLSSFSPVTALGDMKAFTIGIQMLDPYVNTDNESTAVVESYDIPAAPTKPLLSQYIAVNLKAGATRDFTFIISLGKPATSWDDPLPAIKAVLKPYAAFFGTTYGTKPAYCPSSSVAMAFMGTSPKFNKTTKTFAPGSSLYSDDLEIDRQLGPLVAAGMDKLIIWQGQIYSSLLTESGTAYEFNPNSDVLDPNLNEVCDTKWTNVTNTLHKHGLKLGWFGRPCSHIMQPGGKASATVECPSKKIMKGSPIPCNLTHLDEACTMASMDTVDTLVQKGVEAFYWDSYLCGGRMTFSQAVRKKYGPDMFIMGEQGVDIDSVMIQGLPWMGMQAGVWDPGFEPYNSVLMEIVNPMGTAIVGAFGADNNFNHTAYSLQSSKTNSVMMLSPNFNQSKGWMKNAACSQLKMSYSNALYRYNAYGKEMKCAAPPPVNYEALKC